MQSSPPQALQGVLTVYAVGSLENSWSSHCLLKQNMGSFDSIVLRCAKVHSAQDDTAQVAAGVSSLFAGFAFFSDAGSASSDVADASLFC